MIPVSVVIITLNEERNLPRLLAGLDFTDDIVVVDSHSEDKSVEIAEEGGCRIFQRDFAGFGDQKQYAVTKAKYDWILALDADEEISPQLRETIIDLDLSDESVVYSIRRVSNYLGRWIKHTEWRRDHPRRLFNRQRARFNDSLVHETLVFDGPMRVLSGPLYHYPYQTVSEHLGKIDRYTKLLAQQGRKQYTPLSLFTRPLWKMFKNLVIHRGFLDGWQGFVVCGMATVYEFLKVVRVLERENADSAHKH